VAKELRQWAPSRWSHHKIMAFLRHVDEHTEEALVDLVGLGLTHVLMAEMRAEYAAALSVTMLHAQGVRTMGQN
jgi:hypothetical protein